MAMTKEQRNARQRQKRIEWKAEIQQLYRKREERIYREQTQVEQIQQILRSVPNDIS